MQFDLLKFQIKNYFPFLKRRWSNLTYVISYWANICAKEFSFSEEDGILIVRKNKELILHGFPNTIREKKLIIMLQMILCSKP